MQLKGTMKFTQKMVDVIVYRAKELGASEGLTHKQGQFVLSNYGENDYSMASLIVNAWDGKSDLIFATQAVIEFLQSKISLLEPIYKDKVYSIFKDVFKDHKELPFVIDEIGENTMFSFSFMKDKDNIEKLIIAILVKLDLNPKRITTEKIYFQLLNGSNGFHNLFNILAYLVFKKSVINDFEKEVLSILNTKLSPSSGITYKSESNFIILRERLYACKLVLKREEGYESIKDVPTLIDEVIYREYEKQLIIEKDPEEEKDNAQID
jgi:hypothetical protein